MKKLIVLVLVLVLVLEAMATPVLFTMLSLTGQVNNRQILVQPDRVQNPLVIGTNLIPVYDFILQPVAGQVLTNLLPWGYTITVDGWPRSAHIIVTNSTLTLNAATLINTNAFAPLNIYLYGAISNAVPTNAALPTISADGGTIFVPTNYDTYGAAATVQNLLAGFEAIGVTNFASSVTLSNSANKNGNLFAGYQLGDWQLANNNSGLTPVDFNGTTATFTGTYIGNGAGLTNISASSLTGPLTLPIGWSQITNRPGTNMVATSYNGLNTFFTPSSATVFGANGPQITISDPASKSNLMVFGADTASEGGGSGILGASGGIAGQFNIVGYPPTNNGGYYNLSGMHIYNGNMLYQAGDWRSWVFRCKDPSPNPGTMDAGSYNLFEGRYNPTAPDKDTTYCNYMLVDNTGNIGLGDLGERADDRSNGNLYPTAKVTVYGSPNNNYPSFQVVHDYRSNGGTNVILFQISATGDLTGNADGLTNLVLSGPTNATAPANTTTPKAWANFTNSTGGVFKIPLYQ